MLIVENILTRHSYQRGEIMGRSIEEKGKERKGGGGGCYRLIIVLIVIFFIFLHCLTLFFIFYKHKLCIIYLKELVIIFKVGVTCWLKRGCKYVYGRVQIKDCEGCMCHMCSYFFLSLLPSTCSFSIFKL